MKADRRSVAVKLRLLTKLQSAYIVVLGMGKILCMG